MAAITINPKVLPYIQVFDYHEADQGETMEFRLIYKGPLPAEGKGSSRSTEKQKLRKYFHRQLKELWTQHPDLREQADTHGYWYEDRIGSRVFGPVDPEHVKDP